MILQSPKPLNVEFEQAELIARRHGLTFDTRCCRLVTRLTRRIVVDFVCNTAYVMREPRLALELIPLFEKALGKEYTVEFR
jgi:hypothetical protein